jgi:hypothetical protein
MLCNYIAVCAWDKTGYKKHNIASLDKIKYARHTLISGHRLVLVKKRRIKCRLKRNRDETRLRKLKTRSTYLWTYRADISFKTNSIPRKWSVTRSLPKEHTIIHCGEASVRPSVHTINHWNYSQDFDDVWCLVHDYMKYGSQRNNKLSAAEPFLRN